MIISQAKKFLHPIKYEKRLAMRSDVLDIEGAKF